MNEVKGHMASLSHKDKAKKMHKISGPRFLSTNKYFRRSSIYNNNLKKTGVVNQSMSIIVISSSSDSESETDEKETSPKMVVSDSDKRNEKLYRGCIDKTNSKDKCAANLFNVQRNICKKVQEHGLNFKALKPIQINSYEDFCGNKGFANSTMAPKSSRGNEIVNKDDSLDNSDSDDSKENSFSENLLDKLYGETWRKNRDDILPKSEKKPRKKITLKNFPLTEVKKKINSDTQDEPKLNNDKVTVRKIKDLDIPKINSKPGIQLEKEINAEEPIEGDEFDFYVKPKLLPLDEIIRRKWAIKSAEKKEDFSTPQRERNKIFADEKTSANRVEKKNILIDSSSESGSPNISPVKSISKNVQLDEKLTTKKKTLAENAPNSYSFLASLSKNVPDAQCDFSAKFFRNNYKKQKEELVKKLFCLYNEKVFDNRLPKDMTFIWNERLRSTAGYCRPRKITHRDGTVDHDAVIQLSAKVLDSADRLRDTLIHELCHAAAWIIDRVIDGHGNYWKTWTSRVKRAFPELPPIKTAHNYEINTKYVFKCTTCGYSIGRHRKTIDTTKMRCGYCRGSFEVLINKSNKKGEIKTVQSTPGKANPFAMFVKENYSTYRTPERDHGAVMKILSEKFKKVKI